MMLVEQSANQDSMDLTFQTSEISVSLESNAVYAYWCYISYTAHYTNNFRWRWNTPNATIASFTQALDTGTNTGQNASRASIFRRPAAGTNRVAGGTSDMVAGSDRKSTRLNSSHVRISYA